MNSRAVQIIAVFILDICWAWFAMYLTYNLAGSGLIIAIIGSAGFAVLTFYICVRKTKPPQA